jgi:hypothetical protein
MVARAVPLEGLSRMPTRRPQLSDVDEANALLAKAFRRRPPRPNESLPRLDPAPDPSVQTAAIGPALVSEGAPPGPALPPLELVEGPRRDWIDRANLAEFANEPKDPRTSAKILAAQARPEHKVLTIKAPPPPPPAPSKPKPNPLGKYFSKLLATPGNLPEPPGLLPRLPPDVDTTQMISFFDGDTRQPARFVSPSFEQPPTDWIDRANLAEFMNDPGWGDPRSSAQIIADETRMARKKVAIEDMAPATFVSTAYQANEKKLQELLTNSPEDVAAIAKLQNSQFILEHMMRYGKSPHIRDLPYPDVALAAGIPG